MNTLQGETMCDFDELFDDLDLEDMFIIGGVMGFVEEQAEDERLLDRSDEGLDPDEDGAL
jgi:hypothetical protein